MRLLWLLLAGLTVAVSIGCGGDSEAENVESVIRTYVSHYIDEEPAEMYALLDSQSQQLCSEERFVAFTGAAREALGEREFEIAAIRDVVVTGEEATATVETRVDGEAAEPTENALIKENGAWRLRLPSVGC
jgi:hypothetical protein